MTYVEAELPASEEQLKTEAIERLQVLMEEKGYVGWTANPAALETILTEVFAGLSSTVLQQTAEVLNASFTQFGVQFLKVLFNEGAYATAKTKWTVEPQAAPWTIPAGTTLETGGVPFAVEVATEVPASASSVSNVNIVALERGTAGNSLQGVIQQVNPLAHVVEVVIEGETTGGTAEEGEEEYRTRLVAALELQAPRPITASNFAKMLLDAPESIAGVLVGRATSIDGYNAATNEPEGKVSSGSPTITEVTSFTGVTVNSEVQGAGIPTGTFITAFSSGSKTITMSQNGTSNETKKAFKVIGSYENQRYTTSFVTNAKGEALTSGEMTKLETWLNEYREINFKCPVEAPTYTKPYVICKVHMLPGYTEATVKANVEAAIKAYLSPVNWGRISFSAFQNWTNYENGVRQYGSIRYNELLTAVSTAGGVAYVWPQVTFTGNIENGKATVKVLSSTNGLAAGVYLSASGGFSGLVKVESVTGSEMTLSTTASETKTGITFTMQGLTVGLTSLPTGTSDVAMPGAAPLPEALEARTFVTIA